MSKKLKTTILTLALTAVVGASAAASACTVKTSHPRAKITVSFNSVEYVLDYTLYRNMYPQTVQHFIELADNGLYNNMIVHNYNTSSDWFTGAYDYYADEYKTAYKGGSGALGDYLDDEVNGNNISKEKQYYDLAAGGMLTPTVYKKEVINDGKTTVDKKDALATLIGEFSENNHKIENNALSASTGCLKMFYYDRSEDNQKVAMVNGFDQILPGDYNKNCATSVFSMQVGSSTSYSASKYCVFGKLTGDNDRDKLDDLLEAISDYIDDNNLTGKFTTSVTATVDKLDTFSKAGSIETRFNMTVEPIIIKSVKISKY